MKRALPYFPAVLPISTMEATSFESAEASLRFLKYPRATRKDDVRFVLIVVCHRSSDMSHRSASSTTLIAWLMTRIWTGPNVA